MRIEGLLSLRRFLASPIARDNYRNSNCAANQRRPSSFNLDWLIIFLFSSRFGLIYSWVADVHMGLPRPCIVAKGLRTSQPRYSHGHSTSRAFGIRPDPAPPCDWRTLPLSNQMGRTTRLMQILRVTSWCLEGQTPMTPTLEMPTDHTQPILSTGASS